VPPEMKHSEMAWIARHTTSVTCSTNIISLEFFANFLALSIDIFSSIAECKHLFQDNCAAINEAKKQ
jgi:hypothetical protein